MEILVIENEELRVEVNKFGAELRSIIDKKSGINYIWKADKEVWGKYAPNLFPAIGIVKGYEIDGKNCPMTRHGFARDCDYDVDLETEHLLELKIIKSDNSRLMYPYHYSYRVRYELDGRKLKLIYIVKNKDNRDIYYQIGGHTALSCEINGAKLEDYYLEFKNNLDLNALKMDKDVLFLRDEPVNIAKDIKILPLSKKMFDEDAYIFRNIKEKEVTLKCNKHSFQVKLNYEDFSTLALWSAKGKGDFICLEPMNSFADTINGSVKLEEKYDVERLAKGEIKTYTQGFEF